MTRTRGRRQRVRRASWRRRVFLPFHSCQVCINLDISCACLTWDLKEDSGNWDILISCVIMLPHGTLRQTVIYKLIPLSLFNLDWNLLGNKVLVNKMQHIQPPNVRGWCVCVASVMGNRSVMSDYSQTAWRAILESVCWTWKETFCFEPSRSVVFHCASLYHKT